MPQYCFECYSEDGGCGYQFTLLASMNDITTISPDCPKCKKTKPIARNYQAEGVNVNDATPKTLGALADKNARTLSADHKRAIYNKNNAYRYNKEGGITQLPQGMSRPTRDTDNTLMPSTKQRSRDIRKNE